MRIPRLFHFEALTSGTQIILGRDTARHVLAVLRLKPGAPLILFDGSGAEFGAHLESVTGKNVSVTVGNARHPAVESPLHLSLAQGISRGERMDYTVQKAVELGVAEIIPVLTERSVVRLDADSAERKRAHWQSVAQSACEQSGRVRVPTVHAPLALTDFLHQSHAGGWRLLLDPAAKTSLAHIPPPPNPAAVLLVGPEGGLSEAEREQALSLGFQGIRLGPRVLRTETAALVALSLMQQRWGDLG